MLKKLAASLISLLAAASFAAVDINTATVADLDSIKGIGPSTSTKILDARKASAFKDWNDLDSRVKGIGETSAAKLSEAGLTVNGAAYPGAPAKAEAKPAKTDAKAAAADDKKAKVDKKAKEEAKAPAAEEKKAKAEAKQAKASSAAPAANATKK